MTLTFSVCRTLAAAALAGTSLTKRAHFRVVNLDYHHN